MAVGCLSGVFRFVVALLYLLIIFPITVIVNFFKWFYQMLGYSYIFFFLALVFGGSFLIANYSNKAIIYTDYFFRCVLYPIIQNVVLPVIEYVEFLYNPNICWWDAVNWITFGYFNNVLVPTFLACGAKAIFVDLGCILTQLFNGIVVYILSGAFLTEYYDMAPLSAAIIQTIDDWVILSCCLCQDLCCLVKIVPFFIPVIPPPFNIILAILMTQFSFWQSIESLINFGSAAAQILWPLIINLLYLTPPQSRPSYDKVDLYMCQFFLRFTVAVEGSLQRFWNTFIPWRLDFAGMLSAISAFSCIIVDSVEVILTVFTNIDIVVFNMFTPWPNTYIGPPYTMPIDLWTTTIKEIIVRILNTHAPVTDPALRFNVAQIGRRTLAEGICIFLTRIICDWTGQDQPCFNTDPDFATTPPGGTNPADAGFLKGFDWCCLTNNLIRLLNDFNAGLYSMFLNTTSAAAWFLWLDTQPATMILLGDVIKLADCIFSLLNNVPVVGYCMKRIFVQLVNFVTSVVEFLIRVIIGLGTLVWDLLAGTYSNNFLLKGAAAITQWNLILDLVTAQDASSFLNCLCYVLNFGIPIPPITLDANGNFVPCPAPQCVPIGFIPPPPVIDKAFVEGSPLRHDSPYRSIVDWRDNYLDKSFHSKTRNRITPILIYDVERRDNASAAPWFHPVYLKENILAGSAISRSQGGGVSVFAANNLQEQSKQFDAFVERKTQDFLNKHNKIQECHANDLYKDQLKKNNPWLYKVKYAQKKLPDTSHCAGIGAYDSIYPGRSVDEQKHIFLRSAENYDIFSTYGPRSEEEGGATWWQTLGHNLTTYQTLAETETMDRFFLSEEWSHSPGGADDAGPYVSSQSPTQEPKLIPPPPPLTTRPTSPPIAGCPAPGQPPNPCFDVCCGLKAGILLGGQILRFVGNLIDGTVRGNFPDVAIGEVQWGYFTGDNCQLGRCLENDVMKLILDAVQPLVCTCKIFNLILPSSPQFPQPDFCCTLTRLADLIANAVQVIINGIKSLALDSPRFIYFNQGYFVRDIEELFDETYGVVICLCQLVRYAIPISQLTGGTIDGGGAFDICCFGMVGMGFAIQLLKLIILSIVNLGTIESYGYMYWRTTPEQPDINKIGFVVQIDATLDAFFGSPGGICAAQLRPQGIGGFNSCVCQVIALIIPIRQFPGEPISDTNCPLVDLCCIVRDIGFFLKYWSRFQFVAIVSFWQSWAPIDNNRCDVGVLPPNTPCSSIPALPYAFLDYVFCTELTDAQINALPLNSFQQIQAKKCGKLNPVLNYLVDVLSTCPCQLFSLVDAWLAEYFDGFDCFCGQFGGLLPNSANLIYQIIFAIASLIRRCNDVTYWQPFGAPSPNGGPNLFSQSNTWGMQTLGPIVDALCETISASMCFIDIFLPFCQEYRKRIVKSLFRWSVEWFFKLDALIEGFIGIFVSGTPCGGSGQDACPAGGSAYGVSTESLANVFVSFFAFPLASFLGDSTVVCSVVNPPKCDGADRCCCYNSKKILYKFVPPDGFFTVGHQCAQCLSEGCTNGIIDSYAYPTCPLTGTPDKPCHPDGGSSGLVSCDMFNRDINKLDGQFMAIVRYLQCLLAQLLPEFGSIVQGLVIIISVIWQLSDAILRLIAAVVIFLFFLAASSSGGGCSCHAGVWVQVLAQCFRCQVLYKEDTQTCQAIVDFTLGWNTSAYPAGHAFSVGDTFPCGNLAYSLQCVAAGAAGNVTNGFVVNNAPNATGYCVDIRYLGYVRVINGPPNLPADYIWVDNTGARTRPATGPFGAPWVSGPGEENNQCADFNGSPAVPCTGLAVITQFVAIFSSLSSIFSTGPTIPTAPAFRSATRSTQRLDGMETMRGFMDRMKQGASSRIDDPHELTGADTIGNILSIVWGYSTEDCMYDFGACACRNFVLSDQVCAPVMKRRRDSGSVTQPVLAEVAGKMLGTTSCDYHMRSYKNVTWDSISITEKLYYMDCMEKVIQGARLSAASSLIPHDFFYAHQGPMVFWNNLRDSVTGYVARDHEEIEGRRRVKRDTREKILSQDAAGLFSGKSANDEITRNLREEASDYTVQREIQARFKERRKQLTEYMQEHPRWSRSMVSTALIEFDQMELKWKSGYYMNMAKSFARVLRDGDWPEISIKERFKILGRESKRSMKKVAAVEFRKAFVHIYDGLSSMIKSWSYMQTDTIWDLYRKAVVRGRARSDTLHPERTAAREAKREMIRTAFRASPLYKWWFGMDQFNATARKLRGGPERGWVNPLVRLWQHLNWVYTWNRRKWAKTEPNFMNMDLHLKDRFRKWFDKRFSAQWTPEILANWQALGRIYLRIKDAVWPGSVSKDVQERFSIGPYCVIDWNKRGSPEGMVVFHSNYSEAIQAMYRYKEDMQNDIYEQYIGVKSANGIGLDCVNASQYMRKIQWENKQYLFNKYQITRDAHGRGFIVNGNCLLMDGLVDQLSFLVTYCIDQYATQLPSARIDELAQNWTAWRVFKHFADKGKDFSSPLDYIPNIEGKNHTLKDEDPFEDPKKWQGWGEWILYRSRNWIRVKSRPPENKARDHRTWFARNVSPQQWARATASAPFNFAAWILSVIDALLNTKFGMELKMIVDEIVDFIENTNTDWYAGPVGLEYWLLFWTDCKFQPKVGELYANAGINLNCKVGVGLESAIAWTTLVMFIVFVIGTLFLPPLLLPLQIIPIALLWLIIVPAAAWHYSPRCWLMTPSLIVPGQGAIGVSVPYWPFPIALPALPFCLVTDLKNLVIKYTAFCWCQIWWGGPLEFICPPYMVVGDACPSCPNLINFLNCRALGLSDGIDNIIYLLVQWFPDFANIVRQISETVFFNGHFGSVMAAIGTYLASEVDRYSNLSPTEMNRYNYCAVITIFSVSGYILFAVIIVTFLAFVWNQLILGISCLWATIVASPFGYFIPGATSDTYLDFTGNGTDAGLYSGPGGGTGADPFIAVRFEDPIGTAEFGKAKRRVIARNDPGHHPAVMGGFDSFGRSLVGIARSIFRGESILGSQSSSSSSSSGKKKTE